MPKASSTSTEPSDSPELLRGTLDMMILAALDDRPRHGYGITRRIEQRSGGVLGVEEGSLYPALHRMVKRGLLSAEWGTSENNRRAKFYRLTPTGRKRLKNDRAAWVIMAEAIGGVMAGDAARRKGATA
ncbi:MAG: PadR family transcriptional regulator [Planctomycetota bacterium]